MSAPPINKHLIVGCLAAAWVAACGSSVDLTFDGDGSGGMGGAASGGQGSGGQASGGQGPATGGDGGMGGMGGMGGEGTGGTPPAPPGSPGFAVLSGGEVMRSASYTLILSTGEAPGGTGVTMSSQHYRLSTGLLSVTEGD